MSYAIPIGMTPEQVARIMNPAPTPEPDIEVRDGVARRPKVQRRKAEAGEEG